MPPSTAPPLRLQPWPGVSRSLLLPPRAPLRCPLSTGLRPTAAPGRVPGGPVGGSAGGGEGPGHHPRSGEGRRGSQPRPPTPRVPRLGFLSGPSLRPYHLQLFSLAVLRPRLPRLGGRCHPGGGSSWNKTIRGHLRARSPGSQGEEAEAGRGGVSHPASSRPAPPAARRPPPCEAHTLTPVFPLPSV